MDFFKCYACLRTLPKAQFYNRPEKRRGVAGTCKQCTNDNIRLHIEKVNSWEFSDKYTHDQIHAHNVALENISHRTRCKDCGAKKSVISRLVKANGTPGITIMCISCGRKAGPHKHKLFIDAGVVIDLLPVHDDRRDHDNCCAISGCYNIDVELHHWLPRHLTDFDIAEAYPQSYLCKYHHDLWHKLMTPYQNKGKMQELP